MQEDSTGQSNISPSIAVLFLTFLKIGSVAFGGYMALISIIQKTIVEKKKLMTSEDILNGISLASLLPGPVAVNVVAYVGYYLRGGIGAAACLFAVILPSFILVVIFSHLYFTYSNTLEVQDILKGVSSAVAAIVASVALKMGKKTVRNRKEIALTIAALFLLIFSPQRLNLYTSLFIIVTFAALGQFLFKEKYKNIKQINGDLKSIKKTIIMIAPLACILIAGAFTSQISSDSLLYLTITFSSLSLLLFGGGFVFIPIIGSIIVHDLNWMSMQAFSDGLAIGQITPGPIVITAAFIGYKVHGILGAFLATVAIFVPPAILMCAFSNILLKIKESPYVQSSLHAIRCGVIGMICAAVYFIINPELPISLANSTDLLKSLLIFTVTLLAIRRISLDIIWALFLSGFAGYFLY